MRKILCDENDKGNEESVYEITRRIGQMMNMALPRELCQVLQL